MSFAPDEIRAIVQQGQCSNPEVEKYVADTLIKRREKIGRYWYGKVHTLDDFAFVANDELPNYPSKTLVLKVNFGPRENITTNYVTIKPTKRLIWGILTEMTEIPISDTVRASIGDFVNGINTDDEGSFFYYTLKIGRVERDG